MTQGESTGVKTILDRPSGRGSARPICGGARRRASRVRDGRQRGRRAEQRRTGGASIISLLDLALADDPVGFVRAVAHWAGCRPLPVVVFAGSVQSAADIQALAAMHVGYVNEHAGTPQILPALAPHLFPDSFNRRTSARHVARRAGRLSQRRDARRRGDARRRARRRSRFARCSRSRRARRSPHASGCPASAAEIDVTGRVAWGDRELRHGRAVRDAVRDAPASIDAFLDAHV